MKGMLGRTKHGLETVFAFGVILTALAFFGVRYLTAKSEAVHYHANFALYVNGVQDKFDGPGYYEEVTACGAENKNNPKERVHMHGQVNHVVHVHANAVTWGQFFANLGYTLGDKAVTTGQGTFVDGAGGNLTFWLNGKKVDSVANRPIGDTDALLVNFGDQGGATLAKEYNAIPKDAAKEDAGKDPASCGGASSKLTAGDRLKHALKFWQ